MDHAVIEVLLRLQIDVPARMSLWLVMSLDIVCLLLATVELIPALQDGPEMSPFSC